jgi:hypothetical protein
MKTHLFSKYSFKIPDDVAHHLIEEYFILLEDYDLQYIDAEEFAEKTILLMTDTVRKLAVMQNKSKFIQKP